MTAYERAAALSAEAPQRAALTFAAARTAWACGQAAASRALLSTARAAAADPVLLSDIARLRGHIEVNIGSATDAHQIFIDAARAVHDADPLRALEIAVAAAIMRTYAVDSGAALQSGDIFVKPSAGDTPRTRCLKQMLARHDADDRGGLVRRSRCARLGTGERRGSGRPRRAGEPRQRSTAAG